MFYRKSKSANHSYKRKNTGFRSERPTAEFSSVTQELIDLDN